MDLDLYEDEAPTLSVEPPKKRMGKNLRNLQKLSVEKMLKVLEKRRNQSIALPMCGTHIDLETGESMTCQWAPNA